MPGPSGTLIVCGGCGVLWEGTAAERAQADGAQAAFDAECEAEAQREAARADREQARSLFVAAGKPVPAWLREEPS